MDRGEARAVLLRQLARYRRLSRTELGHRLDVVDAVEITGPSGVLYFIEIQAFWDAEPDGDIRVLGSIHDGKLRTFVSPLCEDFLVRPDGGFAGE